MKKIILSSILLILSIVTAKAQCAMCLTTLKNNVSNGEVGIAAGLNFGIMYLFFAPYVLIGTVAFFWYRNSKRNAKEIENKKHIRRKLSSMQRG
jgi:hypothetical protein